MKIISGFIFSLTLFISSASFAQGYYRCVFVMPTVDSMQQSNPYEGIARTQIEARALALGACKRNIEFFAPGQCDKFYADPARMECVLETPPACCEIM